MSTDDRWTRYQRMQAELANPVKKRRGQSNMYVGLPELLDAVKPIVHKHGFVLIYADDDTPETVGCCWVLLDVETGGEVTRTLQRCPRDTQSITPAPGKARGAMNIFQAHGSGKSYLKRYSLESMLCICDVNEADADMVTMTPNVEVPTLADVDAFIATASTPAEIKIEGRAMLTAMPHGAIRQTATEKMKTALEAMTKAPA